MRLRFYWLLALLSFTTAVLAQKTTVVEGLVRYSGTTHASVAGYEIKAINGKANTTYTKGNGSFTLTFTDKEPGDKISFTISKVNASGNFIWLKTEETYVPKSDKLEVILFPTGQPDYITPQMQQGSSLLKQVLQMNQDNLARRDSLDRAEKRLKEKMRFIDSVSKNAQVSALGQDAITALQQTKNIDSALQVLKNVNLEKEYQSIMQQKAAAEAAVKKTLETYKLKKQLLFQAQEWPTDSTLEQVAICDKQTLKIYLENDFDTTTILLQYAALALSYNSLRQTSLALDYCLQGIAFAKNTEKHKKDLLPLINFAAGYFLQLGDCDNAIQYQEKHIAELRAMLICKNCVGSFTVLHLFYNELADMYSECGQPSKAMAIYRDLKTLEMAVRDDPDYIKDYGTYEKIAHVYYKMGDTANAEITLDSALIRFTKHWYGKEASKIEHYLTWLEGWQHFNKASRKQAYTDSIHQLIGIDSLLRFRDLAPYVNRLKKDFPSLHPFMLAHNQAFSYGLLTDSVKNKSVIYLAKLYSQIWDTYKKTADSVSGAVYGRMLDTLVDWRGDYSSLEGHYGDISAAYERQGNYEKAAYFIFRQQLVLQQLHGPSDSLTLYNMEVLGNFFQEHDMQKALSYYLKGYHLLKKVQLDSLRKSFIAIYLCERVADMYEKNARPLEAIDFVKERYRYAEKTTEPSEALEYELAKLFHDGGKFKEATLHWKNILRLNAKSKNYVKLARLSYNLANDFNFNANLDSAAKYVQQSLGYYRRTSQTNQTELVERLSILHLILGENFMQVGAYKKAIQWLTEAKKLQPDTVSNISSTFLLSKAYMAQGLLAKGDSLLRIVAAQSPPPLLNHYYQEIIPHLLRQKHFSKAFSLLEACQRTDTSNISLPYYWTAYYAQLGQKEKALDYFTKYAGIGTKSWAPEMGTRYLNDVLLAPLRKEKKFIALCEKIDAATLH